MMLDVENATLKTALNTFAFHFGYIGLKGFAEATGLSLNDAAVALIDAVADELAEEE